MYKLNLKTQRSSTHVWIGRWLGVPVGFSALFLLACHSAIDTTRQSKSVINAADELATARTIPDLGIDLVLISPGEFRMGTPTDSFPKTKEYSRQYEDERPTTLVVLTLPFWLGRTNVTQGQYSALMDRNPSRFKGTTVPVENVSWNDAVEFCHKLTTRERASGRIKSNYVYTLPTEAQWEYACRAGTTGEYAGDFDQMAWDFKSSSGTSHPVGTKQPNPWGLFDMHGNIADWCLDWYGQYPGGSVIDPMGVPSGSARIFRGGSYVYMPLDCRSASRHDANPNDLYFFIGFRLALVLSPAE